MLFASMRVYLTVHEVIGRGEEGEIRTMLRTGTLVSPKVGLYSVAKTHTGT